MKKHTVTASFYFTSGFVPVWGSRVISDGFPDSLLFGIIFTGQQRPK